MHVRLAEATDAAGIGLVHVRSWQAAYQGHFPQDYLDSLDPIRRGEGWMRYFTEGAEESESVLVADADGAVVGFAAVGLCRDEDVDGGGEVRAIYVLAERWGQGVGRNLMAAAVDRLHDAGFTGATLWVLDTNQRARQFYEAAGWIPDGETKQDQSLGFPISEVRYRRRLP